MKPTIRRLLILAVSLAPVLAHAHPGHDGDHDFVWDFEHLASHPLATIACVSLLVAAGYGLRQLIRSRHPAQAPKSSPAKRD